MTISQDNVLNALNIMMHGNRNESSFAKNFLIENQDKTILPLCDLLPTLTDKQQWNIIRVLSVMNDQRAIPSLINCLTHSNNAIISAAAQLLSQLGGEQSVSALVDVLEVCLHNNNTQVTISLVKALGDLGNQQVVQKITQVMHETPSNVVRYTAIISLMKLGNDCVMEDISKYIDSEDHHTKTFAIQAVETFQRSRQNTDSDFLQVRTTSMLI